MPACTACEATVEDGTTASPSCGYAPRRLLVATGLGYLVAGIVALLACYGLLFDSFFSGPILLWIVALLVICGLLLYGLQLLFDATSATVDESLEHYLGVFHGPLQGWP